MRGLRTPCLLRERMRCTVYARLLRSRVCVWALHVASARTRRPDSAAAVLCDPRAPQLVDGVRRAQGRRGRVRARAWLRCCAPASLRADEACAPACKVCGRHAAVRQDAPAAHRARAGLRAPRAAAAAAAADAAQVRRAGCGNMTHAHSLLPSGAAQSRAIAMNAIKSYSACVAAHALRLPPVARYSQPARHVSAQETRRMRSRYSGTHRRALLLRWPTRSRAA